MVLTGFDWLFIGAFFILTLVIGLLVTRKAGQSTAEFFLSGRKMPWWLLGISMVATTFSADTPNLVTDLIRKQGVAGNWAWWAFLLTGMMTVFLYAKLWRRSGVMTDLEFYELRYSGKAAAFLRGFRAIYLGVFFNVMIMASVTLAAIKIAGILLGFSPLQTVLISGVITVIYTSMGGLRGVILTDFFQFLLAMIGMVGAAVIIVNLPEIGGLSALLERPEVAAKTPMLPSFTDSDIWIPLLLIPLAVQWWSSWYPGAEPGGGGYIAQRILAAKDEKNAVGATLLFNVAHYALRPWPWIIIALCSIVVFPDLDSLREAFPDMDPGFIDDDLAFPAMLSKLPHGLLGLVIAALIAAYMSTISTQLNLGASYLVHDYYRRFVRKDASEKHLVNLGRIATAVLMLVAGLVALLLTNALQAFNILLQIGAGTGLIFILRWFWWRINAYSEITAMVVSFIIAVYFEYFYGGTLDAPYRLVIGVGITTVAWVIATFVTRPTEMSVLGEFVKKIRPHQYGWKGVIQFHGIELPADNRLRDEVAAMWLGCIMVYSGLFATGYIIYGEFANAAAAVIASGLSATALFRIWRRLKFY